MLYPPACLPNTNEMYALLLYTCPLVVIMWCHAVVYIVGGVGCGVSWSWWAVMLLWSRGGVVIYWLRSVVVVVAWWQSWHSRVVVVVVTALWLGNGTGIPAGTVGTTRTRTRTGIYPPGHGFSLQNETKNSQNG